MTSLWTVPSLPEVECFRAVALSHAYARHSHDGFAIGVFEKGVGASIHRGARRYFPPAHLVAMNPDEVHTGGGADSRPITYRMFYVQPEFFGHATFFKDVRIYDRNWAKRLVALHRALERYDDPLAADITAIECLREFARTHGGDATEARAGHEPRAIVDIKAFLRDNLHRNVSIGELAHLTGFSRAYLIRMFRKSVGMPPHAWLLQLRINRAKALLASGRPVAEVAGELGFADQSHLTRRFKAVTGLTPGQFARGPRRRH